MVLLPAGRRATKGELMGVTNLLVRVAHPADPKRFVDLDMLVDTGAIFAIVPAPLLRRLGIRARKREKFSLADGTTITRRIGNAEFGYGGHVGAATVIFGEPGDACLLGALALESLGFILDPVKRALRPLPMVL
jgi:predicted aspartyl protease